MAHGQEKHCQVCLFREKEGRFVPFVTLGELLVLFFAQGPAWMCHDQG